MTQVLQLGEIATVVMGQAPPGKDCNKEKQGEPFVKAGEFSVGRPLVREWTTNPLKKAKDGDVLVCVVGATAGKVNLGIDCAIGRSVAAVRPLPQRLDTNYLHHFLQAKTLVLRHGSQGLAQGVITREMLLGLEIPLPPLEEQRRIAGILDKAANLKTLSNKADRILADIRASRLRELLRGARDRQSSCDWIPISELIREQPNNGIFRKNHEYETGGQAGFPVVWVEQLFRGTEINTRDCRRLSTSEAEIAKYGLANGDILFCRSSLKPEGIAKANIYLGTNNQALFECHLIRISPDRSKVHPIFLNECLNLPEVRNEARRLSKTSTMTTIDQDGILAIKIPVPPLHVQDRFAAERELLEAIRSRRLRSAGVIEVATASLLSAILGR